MKVATLSLPAYPPIFHLFLHLKKHVAGQNFHVEAKNEDTTCLREQVAELCDIRIQKLVPRLNKCLDKGGDYFEK